MANPIVFTPALKGESPNELFLESLFLNFLKASVIQPRRCTFPNFPGEEHAWCPATYMMTQELYEEAKHLYQTLEIGSLESRVILVLTDYICRLAMLVSDLSITKYARRFLYLTLELRRSEILGLLSSNEEMSHFLAHLESDMAWLSGSNLKLKLPKAFEENELSGLINTAAIKAA